MLLGVVFMPKKKLSDMVFQRVKPPDEKENLSAMDLAKVIVKRIGLKRKVSRADHANLLLEMIRYRKEEVPISIEKISQLLGVSQSQSYEELRKWRTLGLVEFVKLPVGDGFLKGYMISAPTANRLLDKVESQVKAFIRSTRRIAKDFDDIVGLEAARAEKSTKEELKIQEKEQKSPEPKVAPDVAGTKEEKTEKDKTTDIKNHHNHKLYNP